MSDNNSELNAVLISFRQTCISIRLSLAEMNDKKGVSENIQLIDDKVLESNNSTKEVEECSNVTSEQVANSETQLVDEHNFKKQLSEYLYVESFTDMSLEDKNILRELWGFPPRFEPVARSQSCIEREEQCCIEEYNGWKWCDQDGDGSCSCEHVKVGFWEERLSTS